MKSFKRKVRNTSLKLKAVSRFALLFFVWSFTLYAPSAQAQNPLVPCGLDAAGKPNCTFADLFQLFANIYNLLLGLAAIVAVLMLVFAGVRMLLYYWSEQPESELEGAKNTLRRAIFGLIIIITAYLVVNTVLAVLGAGPLNGFFQAIGG